MDMDRLADLAAAAQRAWDNVMAMPHVGPSARVAAYLTGMSGAFWSLSRVFGWIALKIHDALFVDFAALFALTYNLVLASLFGGVMALAVFKKAGTDPLLPAYQAVGFVFVYLVLSAAYANERGGVDPHSGAGFSGGIAAYLAGGVFPQWISKHPVVLWAHDLAGWVVQSPAGKIVLALSVVQGVLYAVRAVRRWFFWKSVKIGKTRFFFSFAY